MAKKTSFDKKRELTLGIIMVLIFSILANYVTTAEWALLITAVLLVIAYGVIYLQRKIKKP